MNHKRTTIIIILIGVLLIVAVAAVILLSGGEELPLPQTGGQGNTSQESASASNGTGEGTTSNIQQPVEEGTLDVDVSLGVGGRDEGNTGSTETTSETTPQEQQGQSPTGGNTASSQPDETTSEQTKLLTYAQYLALSPEKQEAYVDSFDSLKAFIAWHNEAKAEYEKDIPSVIVTGPVDFDDLKP